jgi:transcriptional regulator with XRE-family HTH domain
MVKSAKATEQAQALGRRLRAERKKAKMTQKEVAKQIGCAQQTVLDLENGNVEWSRYLPDIAKFLGVSVAWLSTGEGPTDRPTTAGAPIPIVQWDFFTSLATADAELSIEADDWLDGCPARHGGKTVALLADEAAEFAMLGQLKQNDQLFIDRDRSDNGLLICIMAAWQRAEVRELIEMGGKQFLRSSNPAVPSALMPVTTYTNRNSYLAALAQPGLDTLPCLVFGRVIYQGVMR